MKVALDNPQKKTGTSQENSPNRTKKTGRGDGREGGQKSVGHLSTESVPERKVKRKFSGSERVGSSDLAKNPFEDSDITATDASPNQLGARTITDTEEEVEE